MIPQTITGWILFAAMWLAGPITGYLACSLVSAAWEREPIGRREAIAFGAFGGLMLVSTLTLVFVQGL